MPKDDYFQAAESQTSSELISPDTRAILWSNLAIAQQLKQLNSYLKDIDINILGLQAVLNSFKKVKKASK